MVLELYTKWCASEDAGTQGEWIVSFHISWTGERIIPYKGVETSP